MDPTPPARERSAGANAGGHEGSTLLTPLRAGRRRLYGAVVPARRRAHSVPVPHARRVVVVRRAPRPHELSVREQTTKLAEEAKKALFHGSFTSSHGAMFSVPSMRRQEKQQPHNTTTARPGASQTTDVEITHATKRKGNQHRLSKDVAAQLSALKEKVSSPLLHDNQSAAALSSFITGVITVKERSRSADASYAKSSNDALDAMDHGVVGGDTEIISLSPHTTTADTTVPQEVHLPQNLEKSPKNFSIEHNDNNLRIKSAEKRPPIGQKSEIDLFLAQVRVGGNNGGKTNESVSGKLFSHRISFSDYLTIQEGDVYTEDEEEEDEEEELVEEMEVEISYTSAMIQLMTFAFPAALTIGFTFALSVIPLAFIGSHLGELYLSGASVGYFLLSIFVLYPTIGMTFAMDTLCSHEYGRDNNSQELGLLLQRGILINLVFLIPECLLIYNLDFLLVRVYGVEVTNVAKDFLHFMPLFVLPLAVFVPFNKFLCNQMRPGMPMIALAVGFLVTPFVQRILTPMGVQYAMVGMCLTSWTQLIVIIIVTFCVPQTRHTLGSPRIYDALRLSDIKGYLELSIPSAIFVAAEASSFDLTVLLCAYFGEQSGAAWSGIMNILFLSASLAGGLSTGACANIGRCIGSNEPINTRTYVNVAILIVVVISLFDCFVLYHFFDFLMKLFGTEGDTLQLARQILVLLPAFHIADAVQFTFQGIFSGLGKNHLGALILLLSLWGVGIPMAFFLGLYLRHGIFGVCLGMTIGLCIEAPAMVATTCLMDYKAICEAFMFSVNSCDEEEEAYIVGEDVLLRSGIAATLSDFSTQLSTNSRGLKAPPHSTSVK